MSKPTMTQAADAMALALPELAEAVEAYERAKDAAREASRSETEALNRLNAKQKEVERLYADMRSAGVGDWKRNDPLSEGLASAAVKQWGAK